MFVCRVLDYLISLPYAHGELIHTLVSLTSKDPWVYLGAKALKTTSFEKMTYNYFLTSIFLDLIVR
jgi:hypothetical protein